MPILRTTTTTTKVYIELTDEQIRAILIAWFEDHFPEWKGCSIDTDFECRGAVISSQYEEQATEELSK